MFFKIIGLNEVNFQSIIHFLESTPDSTIYHHPLWLKAIQNTFGHKTYYLLEYNDSGSILSLIPFMKFKSVITGKKIISLPLSTHCDPLIDVNKLTEALKFISESFADYKIFDLRTLKNFSETLPDYSGSTEYFTHILELKDSLEETFNSFHPTSVRASIRRAEKNNLKIIWGKTLDDLISFYNLKFKLRKRLRLPPIPFEFFKNVWIELSKNNLISLPIVYKDNKPIAAGFVLNFKDKFYLEYTASEKDYLNLYPNHKLFFDVIKKAFNSGAKYVDFGRTATENTSLISFKEKWATEKNLIYHYHFPPEPLLQKSKIIPKKLIMTVNSFLPEFLLNVEGKIIYRYFL
ncbi:MAG: GNAT family N-acetyltransferase [Ignavibacterium album]|uniref:GNAT family N-acetyltransferase n=1 Tax=Ignavibacterium album TaxID=591197 RepID=UPI0026EDC33F|nr:GNAT family N-acetyltransferase [Ignavibacterium album]MCX8105875.1 GNAT family N-acetyltransferase [Ignavibacterium album]